MTATSDSFRRVLLACGAVSSVLFIGSDLIAARVYPGYSYTAQQVSELSAIGAPTRPFWVAMSIVNTPLTIAFGMGVWLSARAKLSRRVVGVLMVAFGVIGFMWVLFAPMNLRGIGNDAAHLVFAGVQVPLMVLFISVGGASLGKRFRLYSIATVIAILVPGTVVAIVAAPAIAAGRATPWMGVVERVSVYAPLVWIAVLAVVLWRRTRQTPTSSEKSAAL
jgi:hypothetical protein